MWNFSERFMEDCIHANPSAFLGSDVTILSRQQRIGSFVPDLILADKGGNRIILEIQQNALDRYHLYKSLEYRDLLAEQEKCDPPKIMLFCETMDGRFRQLIKTHHIDLIQMDRKEFITIAIASTPHVVGSCLTEQQTGTGKSSREESSKTKIQFRPLNWGFKTHPSTVLSHLYREFGRLAIDIDDVPRRYYQQIYWDLSNFLDEEIESAIEKIWIPGAWNHDRLLERGQKNSWQPYPEIGKPRIEIRPYLTSKGNLSIVWRPLAAHRIPGGSAESDWIWWPGDSTYGWSRPNNELFFIREVSHLNPGVHFSEWDDRVNYAVLDGIFIGLIKSCFDHFVQLLRVPFEVTLVNAIELDLVEVREDDAVGFAAQHIVGWRIYNVEERAQRDQEAWLANFLSTYGFSIDLFARLCREAQFDKKSNTDRYVWSRLKRLASR